MANRAYELRRDVMDIVTYGCVGYILIMGLALYYAHRNRGE